jgi:tetratricopeptide (TPR) repeat protein
LVGKSRGALKSEIATVYVERGDLYYQQEKYDETLEQLNQASKLMPDEYTIRMAIGFAYFGKGECNRAEGEFQSLIEAQPRFANGHVGLGFAKLCDGDAGKALTYFRKAIDLEPYNEGAYRGMDRLCLARTMGRV